MFGAIWAFISGFAVAKDAIKGSVKDSKSKEKATVDYYLGNNDARTYYDHKGKRRSLDTNELVSYYIDPRTHDHLLTTVHGKVLRNFSEENRQKKINYAIVHYDNMHTVILVKEGDPGDYKPCGFTEAIYKDINTEQLYVTREFKEEYSKITKKREKDYYYKKFLNNDVMEKMGRLVFYMDTNTGHLVRLTDSYLRSMEEAKKRAMRKENDKAAQIYWEQYKYSFTHAKEFMEKFNEYQDSRKNEMDLKNDSLDFRNFYCGKISYCDTETDKQNGY